MTLLVQSTLKVARREFHRIAERKTLYLFSIVVPVILFSFLSLIYVKGAVRNIPVVIYDEDNSELSRTIIRSIDATASMEVVGIVHSQSEAEEALKRSDAYAAFCFPKNMEANIKKGKGETVTVLKNNFNLIIGNSIYKDASTIIKTISVGITMKRMGAKGIPAEQSLSAANAISVETQTLYNPYYNYADYLLPGLLPVMLQLIIVVPGVLVFSSEFSHNTFHDLVQTANGSTLSILIGKMIPHLGVHMATAIGILGIVFPLFSVQIHGSIIGGLTLYAAFIFATFGFALVLSSIFHEQFFATEAALLISTPAFVYSGYTMPVEAMPAVNQWIAALMPFTFFIRGFIKAGIMDTPFGYYLGDILILCAVGLGFTVISYFAIHHSLKKFASS